MANKDTAKAWFETGDKPTQTQFEQVFDWLRWKDEGINMADVAGLVAALSGKVDDGTFNAYKEGQLVAYDGSSIYVMGAGTVLEYMAVYYGEAGTLKLSAVAYDGEDILPEQEMAAGWNKIIALHHFTPAGGNLYMTGIPAGSKINFVKRVIKMA